MVIAAIDIGKTVLQAASLEDAGGEVKEARFPADRKSLLLGGWLRGATRAGRDRGDDGLEWIARELQARGLEVLLLDPGEAAARKGKKRRPKTDHLDARFLVSLLQAGMAPEGLAASPGDLRAAHADPHPQGTRRRARARPPRPRGLACRRGRLPTRQGRRWVEAIRLEGPVRLALDALLRAIDELDRCLEPLAWELARRARVDHRLRALRQIYGVGPIVACHLLAEIGEAHRFSRARQVVRLSGLDPVALESGETKRRGGLAKAGPPLLRWALVEAAKHASRRQSPDHERWSRICRRRGSTVADLTIARTIAGRAFHVLRGLDAAA